jgi:general secretion pathway protein H
LRAPRHSPGFTLIELLIVVSVIALVSAAAVPALGALTGAEARKAAGELAGAMRTVFDSAALRHATCRIVLSPAKRSWWAECAPARAAIAEPGKEPRRPEPDGKPAAGGPAAFARFDSPVARPRELPGSARFKAIRVEGRDALAGEDDAWIHFFAGGRAQAARVVIADGDHAFTVRLEPFTGRAIVVAGEPEEREP